MVPSALDGILFMGVSQEESERRSKNRKIDPQTNIVYHMEDSPPEESKDTKLLDRLQPYKDDAGNPARITTVNKRYNRSVNLINQFAEQFGLVDPATLACKVPLNMKIKNADWQNWRQKDTVKEAVLEKVRSIVEFKQDLFNRERKAVLSQIEEEQRSTAVQETADGRPFT